MRKFFPLKTPFSRSQGIPSTTPAPTPQKADIANSITEVLSHYGPWGYLMLGMLICGTVLMFCGLWECCFRRPKPHDDEPLQTAPTTVLIINHNDAGDVRPPSYEDLDQPPSYSVLFPNLKESDGEISGESGASTGRNGAIECACAIATEMSVLSDRNERASSETRSTRDLDVSTTDISVAREDSVVRETNNGASADVHDFSVLNANAGEISDPNANASEVGVVNDASCDVSTETRDTSALNANANDSGVQASEIRVLVEDCERHIAETS